VIRGYNTVYSAEKDQIPLRFVRGMKRVNGVIPLSRPLRYPPPISPWVFDTVVGHWREVTRLVFVLVLVVIGR
jgi:hypothetical protein